MRNGRRRDIYRLQAHALSDAFGICGGALPHARMYENEWPALLCPLCVDWYPFDEMDEDHAPAKAGQSRIGPTRVVVMTCRIENQLAGASYERRAHELGELLTAVPDPLCSVHQSQRFTRTGLAVMTDGTAFESTDVRAAYLLAFATLGYRWALTSRLDNLRVQLREHDLRYAARDFDILCAHGVPGLQPFYVYEVVGPIAAVLVTGAHASVLLPCHYSPADLRGTVTSDAGLVRVGPITARSVWLTARLGRRWPWPQQFVRPGGTAEKTWDDTGAGNLFHFDRCADDSHHTLHAVPRRALLAALVSAVG